MSIFIAFLMKGILPCFRFHVRGQLVTWFLLKAVKTDVVCTHGVVRGAGSRDPSLRTPGRPGAMNPLTPAVSRADSEQSPAGTVYRREQQTPAGPPLQPLYNHSYLCKLEPTAVEFLPSLIKLGMDKIFETRQNTNYNLETVSTET